jgi:D-3-phosphoglycerate dehydrogenase
MSLLLALLRRLPEFFRAQQLRQFERRPTDDLHGKTVGIVGFGGNGRRIAEVLSVCKVHLLATDLYPIRKPPYVEELWPAEQIGELLASSHIVILCVPLNQQTAGWFDNSLLSQMRRGSYLINVARGPVVVERALVDALRSGHLSGAGLDVTEIEPLPEDSPLWDLPQVVITPHVGAQAFDRVDRATQLFCENLQRVRAGLRPWNLVDKALGFPHPEDHYSLRSSANLTVPE